MVRATVSKAADLGSIPSGAAKQILKISLSEIFCCVFFKKIPFGILKFFYKIYRIGRAFNFVEFLL